jgi:hypothetical protein
MIGKDERIPLIDDGCHGGVFKLEVAVVREGCGLVREESNISVHSLVSSGAYADILEAAVEIRRVSSVKIWFVEVICFKFVKISVTEVPVIKIEIPLCISVEGN